MSYKSRNQNVFNWFNYIIKCWSLLDSNLWTEMFQDLNKAKHHKFLNNFLKCFLIRNFFWKRRPRNMPSAAIQVMGEYRHFARCWLQCVFLSKCFPACFYGDALIYVELNRGWLVLPAWWKLRVSYHLTLVIKLDLFRFFL